MMEFMGKLTEGLTLIIMIWAENAVGNYFIRKFAKSITEAWLIRVLVFLSGILLAMIIIYFLYILRR